MFKLQEENIHVGRKQALCISKLVRIFPWLNAGSAFCVCSSTIVHDSVLVSTSAVSVAVCVVEQPIGSSCLLILLTSGMSCAPVQRTGEYKTWNPYVYFKVCPYFCVSLFLRTFQLWFAIELVMTWNLYKVSQWQLPLLPVCLFVYHTLTTMYPSSLLF